MTSVTAPDPEEALQNFLSKYAPEIRAIGVESIGRVRALVPGAFELVYDNYNALVVAFGPSAKTSEVLLSVALYPRWVNLFFAFGSTLRDPSGLLKGSGTRVRRILLENSEVVDRPEVRELIAQAIAASPKPIDPLGPRHLLIKLVSAKQRPRRPA